MTDGETALANNSAQFGQLIRLTQCNTTREHDGSDWVSCLSWIGSDQTLVSANATCRWSFLRWLKAQGRWLRQGQLTGQDYLAQMLLGGTNANINAQKVSSELMGNLYDSMLDNLGGTSNADGSQSGIGGLLLSLGGLFGSLFGF